MTILLLLVLIALGLTLANAVWKLPLWPAMFVFCLIELLRIWPPR